MYFFLSQVSAMNMCLFFVCFMIKRKCMLFFKSFTSVSGSVLSPWRRESSVGNVGRNGAFRGGQSSPATVLRCLDDWTVAMTFSRLLADQNLKFIDPFCKIAAKSRDQTLVQTIARGVFEVIVDQSPFVPEETVKEQKTQVGGSNLSEEETCENEMTWRKAVRKKKAALGRYHFGKEFSQEGGQDGGGSVEDTGPLLQFDYKAVADRLLEMTNRKNVPPFNRKSLSELIKKFQDLSEAGSLSHLSFAEDSAADEDDQTRSQGTRKKKGNKLLQKTDMAGGEGTKFFPAKEEESKGGIPKKKRKKKKKNQLQAECTGPSGETTSREQNGSQEPEASPKRAPEASGAELGILTMPGTREQSSLERPSLQSRRKRPRKRSPRIQVEGLESTTSPLEGVAPRVAPASGAPVLKRRRELGALLVNGSGPPVLAWPAPQREGPPASPADRGDCTATLPPGEKPKKSGGPSGLDLYNSCAQKAAILKKRKKMKEMSNSVEPRGMKLVPALGSGGVHGPLKKKLRTEKDFVKFDAVSSPKPLFFRRAKGSIAASPGPTLQSHRTPSSSKKVTFGLNRNMTAEFKKTDKSILVSPTGPSRVAFNPEQRPLHGVLKTPTSSPASTPLGPKKPLTAMPKRRPTAMDFF
ncbi:ribosomal RNA processing protein 1 homolog B isoform X4 [Muntiacus reevesi]|uniref:ribosomal RNA processing protein 1 homolog B isoform X4 n=1 Tax=Muntiacus reevesi TaxID=9886 RepID=UPI003306EF4F